MHPKPFPIYSNPINNQLHLDPKPLLRLVLGRFFGNTGGFVDMVAKHVPSPIAGAAMKVCK